MTLTEEQIAEIRARVDAATPGAWRLYALSLKEQDVDFLDHCRDDIPALLSALEAANKRAEEALKALRGLLEPFEDDDCRYDHHGYCQAHFLQEGDECCVEIASRAREGGKVDG